MGSFGPDEGLLLGHHGGDRHETQSMSRLFRRLDSVRVLHALAQHLKAAADAHDLCPALVGEIRMIFCPIRFDGDTPGRRSHSCFPAE